MAEHKNKFVGAIPGYSGHVPCMRNHVLGRSYTDATLRAAECQKAFRHDDFTSAMPLTVDSRPQGRDSFYAQAARPGYEYLEKQAIEPRVSKRDAPLETRYASGLVDLHSMKKVVGTTAENVIKTIKTTSIPELPYKDRNLHIHKHFEPMYIEKPDLKTVPGYTGHKHGAQHVFARSYGSSERRMIEEDMDPGKPTKKDLFYYVEPRPVGEVLVEKHKIPGYQGYIPSRDNYIIAKPAGKASDLAALAALHLNKGDNPSRLVELVDSRPQGHIDLYAESKEKFHMDEAIPLDIRVNKKSVKNDFLERRPDYKFRERVEPDMKLVLQGKHHIRGYTGHVHASQHLYGHPFGKITRALHGRPADTSTSEKFLAFCDTRALVDQSAETKLA